MKLYSKKVKRTAWMLLAVLTLELITPNISLALTTGPSQPEVQGFEPVGTTDMVDMFSGDFVYNIPLMDVEGYPVNISYHGGVTMEQEASWVGLGWNINPGVINRNVRGIPDDFNGDSLIKDLHIKPEENIRAGIGWDKELAGVGDPFPMKRSIDVGGCINVSNYRGVSLDFTGGFNVKAFKGVSADVNMGVGSQSGSSIDYSARYSTSEIMSKYKGDFGGANLAIGGGYNTRAGIKDLSLSFSVIADKNPTQNSNILGSSYNIPIGMRNYVPVITNSSTMTTINGRLKGGISILGTLVYGNINAMYNKITFNNDASRSAYGYLYLQNARKDNSSILDFTRDKDGVINKSLQYLPIPNMTYDVYNVSGQGTGGMFRPFRNDFGNVYDPHTYSETRSNGGSVEIGHGDIWEAGYDYTHSETQITSGPWLSFQRSGTTKGFTDKKPGSIYENFYFKQGGELTEVDSNYFELIGKKKVISPYDMMKFPQTKPGSQTKRDPRANLIHFHTAEESSVPGVVSDNDILSYDRSFSGYANPVVTKIKRVGNGRYQRKKDHLSEIIQTQKDGRKYVFGIPAINNVQREITFSVGTGNVVDLGQGTVSVQNGDITPSNGKGRENYYSSNITPSYTHSYLLTSVLSSDYIDVTGDGVSDDDLGTYTRFNYTRTDSDYRWVSPYSPDMRTAQYNPGFWSDKKDDKANLVCGSREQWYLHSIETKNYIAEFYTSEREDAKGILSALLTGTSDNDLFFNTAKSGASLSYKLDSIVLFNKHDRFVNHDNAKPIKTIYFKYSYALCSGAPNAVTGKLTLDKIYFKYGTSQKSMASPYRFNYGPNPAYDLTAKDRWGNYKQSSAQITNYEFPYVNQTADNDAYASSWSLTQIVLPSGGVINATYESDDYAYVQNQPANEMFMVSGVGNSPSYVKGNLLYQNNISPNRYLYFKRQITKELPTLSFVQNYMGRGFKQGGENTVYFNFNVQLTRDVSTYEQVKGYMNVLSAGKCPNDTLYGYVLLSAKELEEGGSSYLNPISYTAINTSRYNLPQVIYPGSDPDESDIMNILRGLLGALDELQSTFTNPVTHLIKRSYAKEVNLSKCYIRLQSPGLCKKGGGQRVKRLTFSDRWDALSGGNSENAVYGKTYDYTITDPVYGKISSGVASYEPLIGGDENPCRQPAKYVAQSGHSFPPIEPVELYQELPLGESLFPPASVGYSSITVKSIHADAGRSSQGIDKYEFYTAKDFPVQVSASATDPDPQNLYDFFTQVDIYRVKQGYTLIFNDMHGKPKRVEHDVFNLTSNTLQPISYTVYNYKQKDGVLDNNVPALVKSGTNIVVRNRELGVEEDITLDSREKNEVTTNTTVNGNLNFSTTIFPIPIPTIYPWVQQVQNEFQSAVVAKVIQQYGLIDNVVSYSEGAVTTVKNEIYDPVTGQAVVTSVNNEYQDAEYTTNIPAYWVYKGMGPSYNNIGYKDTGTISVGANHMGYLNMTNTAPLTAGDELAVKYTDATGTVRYTTAYVMGVIPQYTIDSFLDPVAKYDTFLNHHWVYKGRYCFNHHAYDVTYYNPVDEFCCEGTHGSTYKHYLTQLMYSSISSESVCFNTDSPPPTITGFFTGQGEYNISSDGGCCPITPWAESYAGTNVPITITVTPNADGTYNASGSITLTNISSIETRTFPYSGIISGGGVPPTDSSWEAYYTYSATAYHHWIHFTHSTCYGVNILPRFPLNTTGWDIGNTLQHASIEVISSGQKNMLDESAENYTSMSSPINASGTLNTYLTGLISLKGRTFADSNTAIPYNFIANADSINPFSIGERGLWRIFNEYAYLAPRNYTNVTNRNSGLFNANNLFAPVSGLPTTCFLTPYNYWMPDITDANWHKTRTVTKWSPSGKEIENMDAVGNYSTALFGYNESLPVAVGANMKQGDLYAEGFEDYSLLQYRSLVFCMFSPLNHFAIDWGTPPAFYGQYNSTSGDLTLINTDGHTGKCCLKTSSSGDYTFTIPVNSNNYAGLINNYNTYYTNNPLTPYRFSSANEYLPFKVIPCKEYILSYWMKRSSGASPDNGYTLSTDCGVTAGSTSYRSSRATNIIDQWQLVETKFIADASSNSIKLPGNAYIDDIRIFPSAGNMKSFVYDAFTFRLAATLDENNFATMYEYDQEGNLVRTKKETTKGIMTISESRRENTKN